MRSFSITHLLKVILSHTLPHIAAILFVSRDPVIHKWDDWETVHLSPAVPGGTKIETPPRKSKVQGVLGLTQETKDVDLLLI